jgi:hypothetical protein
MIKTVGHFVEAFQLAFCAEILLPPLKKTQVTTLFCHVPLPDMELGVAKKTPTFILAE